jgi:hypothetical protein
MRNSVIAVLALAGVVGLVPSALAQRGRRSEDPAARYGWLFGLDTAFQQARRTDKPLMVVLRCVP